MLAKAKILPVKEVTHIFKYHCQTRTTRGREKIMNHLQVFNKTRPENKNQPVQSSGGEEERECLQSIRRVQTISSASLSIRSRTDSNVDSRIIISCFMVFCWWLQCWLLLVSVWHWESANENTMNVDFSVDYMATRTVALTETRWWARNGTTTL